MTKCHLEEIEIEHPSEVCYAWSVNADPAKLYNNADHPASIYKTADLQVSDTDISNCKQSSLGES